MRPWWQSSNAQQYSWSDRLRTGLLGIVGFATIPIWLTAIHLPACMLVAMLIVMGRFTLADAWLLVPFALAYDALRLAILNRTGHLTARIDRIILADVSWTGANEIDRADAQRAAARFGRFSTHSLPRLAYWLASAPLIAGILAFLFVKILGKDTNETQGWAFAAADLLSFLRPMFGGYDKILAELQARGVGPVRRFLWLIMHDLWLVTFFGALACALAVPLKDDPRTEVQGDTRLFDLGVSEDGVRNMVLGGGGALMLGLAFCCGLLAASVAPVHGPWCRLSMGCKWPALTDLPYADWALVGHGLSLAMASWVALLPSLIAPKLMPAARTCRDGKGWQLVDRRTKKT